MDKVMPAYWLVTSDVNEARKHLNFLEIGKLPAAQQKAFLFEAVNMIQLGAMPLLAYLRVHPNAAVTPEELAVLRNYLTARRTRMRRRLLPRRTLLMSSMASGSMKRTAESTRAMDVKPEFNGVAYIPDYKNWKVISSTDRFDNHTLREIPGNDVAVKAIAENHINPWPDGRCLPRSPWHSRNRTRRVW
jgi:ribonuclease D